MRNFKKALSLCLVLVLLVGTLSITAFAEGTYTIKFFVYGDEQTDWVINADVGNSVYTAIVADLGSDVSFTPVYGGHYALTTVYGYTSNPSTTIPSGYSGTAVSGHPGYFLLGTGSQGYHYLYAGYDWTYHYPSGADLWDYMDQHYPAANSVIEVEYSLQVTDWWSSTPIA